LKVRRSAHTHASSLTHPFPISVSHTLLKKLNFKKKANQNTNPFKKKTEKKKKPNKKKKNT